MTTSKTTCDGCRQELKYEKSRCNSITTEDIRYKDFPVPLSCNIKIHGHWVPDLCEECAFELIRKCCEKTFLRKDNMNPLRK